MAKKTPLRLHPLAEQEALAAYRWYEDRNALVADHFIIELDAAMDLIAESPGRWPRIRGRYRRFVLGRGASDRLSRRRGRRFPVPTPRLSLDQLATAAGLPARIVRYYIQLGLVERPVGEKRAAYYTPAHLEQLLTVQRWSEGGLSLESIRRLMAGELPEAPPEPRGRVEVRSHMTVTDGPRRPRRGAGGTGLARRATGVPGAGQEAGGGLTIGVRVGSGGAATAGLPQQRAVTGPGFTALKGRVFEELEGDPDGVDGAFRRQIPVDQERLKALPSADPLSST